ncbi:cupin domain-containing protein [Pelagicoccus sp. SDUM812003]|uniref:JmjC domain-containing protein n=1 Tax=Pelagicoccus sp. SDUM812003 TaxID=3041267 RepID=UPI002810552F|nr:cupin domain-containing protein [Pelagicoccus sp. SDUM812003]MDQ8202799.1 cupin domain-containing protein [Pelagicoccus sp. SDUM812003]
MQSQLATQLLPDSFLEKDWERNFRFLESFSTLDHKSYFSLEDAESIFRFAGPVSEVRCLMAFRGKIVKLDSLLDGPRAFRVEKIMRHFKGGATLRPTNVHERSERIRALASRLTAETGSIARVNAYLTPSRSYAFKPHADPYNVVVYQLRGRKRWKIWSRRADRPLEGEHPEIDADSLGEPEREFDLEPGQAIYIPRGLAHAASALYNEPSIHLTIGLHAPLWLSVAHDALAACADRDGFLREFAPVAGQVAMDRDTAFETLGRVLGSVQLEDLDESLRRHEELRQSMIAAKEDSLADAEAVQSLNLDSEVGDARSRIHGMDFEDDYLSLNLGHRNLKLQPSLRKAAEFVWKTERFEVSSIPELPGGERSKLLFARYLLNNGALGV